MTKWAIFSLFFCFLLLIGIFGNNAKADQTEPTAPPPEQNMPAYLTIGEENQVKKGALRLGTDDVSSPFYYQLEVLGEGARISEVQADNNLKIRKSTGVACVDDTPCGADEYCSYGYCRQDTLYVNADNDKVCIGPCLDIEGSKLEVSGGGMLVSKGSIYAASSDNQAFYGQGDSYGVQGVSSGIDNYGIWAYSALDTALQGFNANYNYSPVYGYSENGYGIYGYNKNSYGLWAGYFEGRVESNADVSGAKFLPTQLQYSLVPFTSGQVAGSYNLGNISVKHFDGTHLWAVDSSKLYKIRAADGFKIFEVSVGSNPTDVIFDGNYIWVTVAGANAVKKLNPYSGGEECSVTITNPQSIVFDSQHYWVTAEDDASGQGILIKVDNTCAQVGEISLTTNSFSLGKIIYNGSYLWALATNDDTGVGSVININPSTDDAMRWKDIGNSPADIFFDNYYYWVTSTDNDSVTRYYLSESKVCSQLDSGGNPVTCQTDAKCSDEGFGACSFAVPQPLGAYNTGDEPSHIAFDGTYIWVTNVVDQNLTRLLAADPSQTENYSLGFTPTGLLFDGTYLWVSSSTGLTKIYSGTGMGSTDLRDTLTLQFNNPLIQQSGSISIDGSGRVGGDMTAEGELEVGVNIWGEEGAGDVRENSGNPLGPGPFNCPAGHFVKNIEVDGDDKVIRIECRPL